MEEVILCVVPTNACIVHAELSCGFIQYNGEEMVVPIDRCKFEGKMGYFSLEGD